MSRKKEMTTKRAVIRLTVYIATKVALTMLVRKAIVLALETRERMSELQEELEATDKDLSQVLTREAELRERYGKAMDEWRIENEERLRAAGRGEAVNV